MRRLPYRGGHLSWFLARYPEGMRFYTTDTFEAHHPVEHFREDVTDVVTSVGRDLSAAAFADPDRIVVCLGSMSDVKRPHPITVQRLLDNARRYEVDLYSSEVGRWTRLGAYLGGGLERLSVDIEGGGFAVFRLRATG